MIRGVSVGEWGLGWNLRGIFYARGLWLELQNRPIFVK